MKLLHNICIAALCIFAADSLLASTLATDSQADPVYATWDPGDNGGIGWGGGWTFRDQANNILTNTDSRHGWFVSTSTNNDNPGDTNGDGDINSPSTGKAWGLYSNTTTNDIYAIRPFDGPLSVGQTVKFDMDNGNIASSQVVGLRFLTAANDINSRDWEFRFVGGGTNYTIVNAAGTGNNTGLTFTREGLHIEFTLTGPTNYSATITKLVDGSTFTQTGALISSSPILALAFKNQEAGAGSASDAYFNNIAIVPEPAVGGLVGLGLILGVWRRRRGP